MSSRPLSVVVLGLSLSSAWGNGHATTYRALLKAVAARGHDVLFLEREQPWYAAHRDLGAPGYARLAFYRDLDDLGRFDTSIAAADAVIIGSFVPEGAALIDRLRAQRSGPLAFYDIDTPVTLARLACGETDYLRPHQIPLLDVYFSFTGGPVLDRLEREFGSPAARALYCSADPDLHCPTGAAPRWDLSYLGTYSTDRQPSLERLLLVPARRHPDKRFCVAGAQYPDDIAWPANVERLEHVPPAEHPAFYAASRYTLNLTRADMIAAGYSPSVRLFEAASCGTPVISDRWLGLKTLFRPGREIATAETTEEVEVLLTAPRGRDRRLGAAARRRFLADHTPAHRAAVVERELWAAMARHLVGGARPPAAVSGETRAVRDLAGQSVLVAGAAGFLGSHLTDLLLARGATVVGLDNLQTGSADNLAAAVDHPAFSLVTADITEPLPRTLRMRRFDRIYNLACAASPPRYQARPVHTLLTSVLGSRNLLTLAEHSGARFLLASTSEVYGDPEVHPQPEDYRGNVSTTGPRACYDEGKRAAETLVLDSERMGACAVRIARIFNTYGPRMAGSDGRVVSSMVSQALAGEDLTIFGDGSQTRSFCYVADLIGGLVALMEHEGPQPGPVNLGNPRELTIGELCGEIVRLTATRSRIVHRPLPEDDPRRRRPDITKARDLLGWEPVTALDDGLRATIAWFEQQARPAAPILSSAVAQERSCA
jgi:nucleoside-diphosphate-sugar epimerase/spore maturation protein CgeB